MAELVATGHSASANDHRKAWFYRYPIVVRLTHWMNASCLVILFMSGLQIFNAHPALYWGQDSDFERPFLSIHTAFTSEGRPVGVTRIVSSTRICSCWSGRSMIGSIAITIPVSKGSDQSPTSCTDRPT